MPNDLIAKLPALLPLACQWAEQQERRILQHGIVLTPQQVTDARVIGVRHPEQVRLMFVRAIPAPEQPELAAAASETKLISPTTGGLTLFYGIFIRDDCREDRHLIAHELAHTAQYERLGGIENFLRQYLLECVTIGYPEAPLEQEAINRSRPPPPKSTTQRKK
jgi:hypothetical protein